MQQLDHISPDDIQIDTNGPHAKCNKQMQAQKSAISEQEAKIASSKKTIARKDLTIRKHEAHIASLKQIIATKDKEYMELLTSTKQTAHLETVL
jgi:uncharacterized protein (DUF3084 family)